jgi:ribosomal protein L37AE/L43A
MLTSAGIDYGCGMTNIDKENGIRFGVISAHDVGQFWYDDSEPDYGPATCPECGDDVIDTREEHEWYCVKCAKGVSNDVACPDEALSFSYVKDGYEAIQNGNDSDIFITKSPYYTYAKFCSPCAPGAGHLNNPCEGGVKTYCFGHEWFEEQEAPYPVYLVLDNERVMPNGMIA